MLKFQTSITELRSMQRKAFQCCWLLRSLQAELVCDLKADISLFEIRGGYCKDSEFLIFVSFGKMGSV